jgi:phosphoglycerol transferase
MRPYQLCFTHDIHGGAVIRSSGLGAAEPWGTWTVGEFAELEFASRLPARFTLRIEASAYGPNINQPFRIIVGDCETTLTFAGVLTQQEIEVNASQASAVLRIGVPRPVSPYDLEGAADTRKLGLGIKKMEIIPHQ